MRGTHSQLTVTTTTDEATGTEVPLFHFPIQICKATEDRNVSFDRASPTGARVERVWRDTVTEKIHEESELVRGVRQGDSFTTIPEEQISAIDEVVSMEDVRVLRTCTLAEVPVDRVTGRYFVQAPPQGGGHQAYRTAYLALAEQPPKGKAKKPSGPPLALEVVFTSTTRQKLGVVYAAERQGCLMLLTLEFAASVREPDDAILAPALAEVQQQQVEMARKVIESLNGSDVDWDAPVDETIEKRRELIDQAIAEGSDFEVPAAPKPEVEAASTDKLEDALKASLVGAA